MMFECKTINQINNGSITNFPLHVWWSEPQIDTTTHQHSFTELVLILGGHADHCLEKEVQALSVGDVFVIPPGVFHSYKNCSEDFTLVNIVFEPNELPMPMIDVQLLPGFHTVFHCQKTEGTPLPFIHIPEEDFQRLRKNAQLLRDEDTRRTSGYRFAMMGIFMMILSDLARFFSHNHGRNPQVFLHINGVISYINCHFKQAYSLSTLCRIAGMSRSTLQRNFLKATGTSPQQYQLQLRIADAAILLRSTSKTIDEIAADLGFANRYYFSRQFQRITGSSPAKYRKGN